MSLSALQKIQEIQARAEKEIAALKADAVTDLSKRLSEAKAVVADLQRQYEELTGKTVTGETAGGIRKRLSTAEKAALVDRCSDIIKNSPKGIGMGEIVDRAGESLSAVRDAVSKVAGIRKTGSKATTLYFLG